MNRFHGATWLLLLALAGFFLGCADDSSKDDADAGLKVVVRMATPTVQASINDAVEVQGMAFLMTTGGDFVPYTHLHLSAADGSFLFPYGSHQDTTDANGGIDFTYVVDGFNGPGIRRVRGEAGTASGEFDLRVNVPDWYVASLLLTTPGDTLYLDEYAWGTTIEATVLDSAGAPLATVPIYYSYPDSQDLVYIESTNAAGRASLVLHFSGDGQYCLSATAGWRHETVCFTVVRTESTP